MQYIEGTDEIEDSEKEKRTESDSEPVNVSGILADTKHLDPLIQEFIHFQVCLMNSLQNFANFYLFLFFV